MKIDKGKLSKALKQLGIFVGKNNVDRNTSLVHFSNSSNKAMMFATDLASAGRAYFDTDEAGEFEFCVEYEQLAQTCRARGAELTATIVNDRENANGEKMSGIEFTDGKSVFFWALHDTTALKALEETAVVPADMPCFEVDAKTLKNAIREAGFARNEKDTQTPYVTGVNFEGCGTDMGLVSTDRHRIAGWKSLSSETLDGMETSTVNGILSPKTISSISLYDDDEKMRIYITDKKIVIVSGSLESYATKINCDFPDLQQMLNNEVVSSYSLSAKDLKESIEIVLGKQDMMQLSFKADSVTVSARNEGGDGTMDDTFTCERVSGNDETIMLKPSDLLDVVKNTSNDNMVVSFRKLDSGLKILSYSIDDGAYGVIAPMRQ